MSVSVGSTNARSQDLFQSQSAFFSSRYFMTVFCKKKKKYPKKKTEGEETPTFLSRHRQMIQTIIRPKLEEPIGIALIWKFPQIQPFRKKYYRGNQVFGSGGKSRCNIKLPGNSHRRFTWTERSVFIIDYRMLVCELKSRPNGDAKLNGSLAGRSKTVV